MQVVEIKNDLVQVRYNSEEQAFSLGDFFVLSDNNADLLAQIIHLETDEQDALCLAKFILNINPDQSTSMYNGYMPSVDSVVSPVSKKEIAEFIAPLAQGMEIGTLINSDIPVQISSTILDFPLYIQADYTPAAAKLLNIIFFKNDVSSNVIFFDIDGLFNDFGIPKFSPGADFKVPLNQTFLEFIYQNDLSELDASEKALVQDILLEIKDYIKTTDKAFIEFSTLYSVVENQYQEQPSEGLILFRNKLIEYKQLGFFADNEDEVGQFEKLLENKACIFSVHTLPKNWQKVVLKYLCESISVKTHLVAQISDKSADEVILNKMLVSKNIIPIFISDYSSKYRKLLRAKIPNLILFQAINEIDDFPLYSTFLNVLYDNSFIIWGEITNFLSIIASPVLIEEKPAVLQEVKNVKLVLDNEQSQDETTEDTIEEEFIAPQEVDVLDDEDNSTVFEDERFETEETEDKNLEISADESSEIETQDENDVQSEVIEGNSEVEEMAEDVVEDVISDNLIEDNFEEAGEKEIIEEETNVVDAIETSDDDTIIEEENFESEELKNEETEELNPEIVEDIQPEEEQDIQDDDLDFLDADEENQADELDDELMLSDDENYEEEQAQEFKEEVNERVDNETAEKDILENIEENFISEIGEEEINGVIPDEVEEIVEEPQPVYEEIKEPEFEMPVFSPADDGISQSNELEPEFVEGNIVFHEKYGRGIIEKVISYGTKTLCSIQFDNIGRRLLDPNLADLKQV